LCSVSGGGDDGGTGDLGCVVVGGGGGGQLPGLYWHHSLRLLPLPIWYGDWPWVSAESTRMAWVPLKLMVKRAEMTREGENAKRLLKVCSSCGVELACAMALVLLIIGNRQKGWTMQVTNTRLVLVTALNAVLLAGRFGYQPGSTACTALTGHRVKEF
jgi:hypothetical protein